MYFQQFYLTCLSHASYILGSEGVACVVDPQRDVNLYLDAEALILVLRIAHRRENLSGRGGGIAFPARGCA